MADSTQPPKTPSSTPSASDPYSNPSGQPAKRTGGIIAVVVILLGLGVYFIANNRSDSGGDNNSTATTSEQKEEKKDDDEAKKVAANSKTADSMSDFSSVCEVGAITNAADYAEPYVVAAFSKTSDKRSWSSVSLKYDAPYAAKHDEYAKVNTVVCAKEKKDAAVKTKTCDFKTGGEEKAIDYYATVYEVGLYEAKTGKKVKDLGEVSGPADTCPMFVTYDKSDPKIVARPDSAGLEAKIVEAIQ